MEVSEKFKMLVIAANDLLKPLDFSKKGNAFFI